MSAILTSARSTATRPLVGVGGAALGVALARLTSGHGGAASSLLVVIAAVSSTMLALTTGFLLTV